MGLAWAWTKIWSCRSFPLRPAKVRFGLVTGLLLVCRAALERRANSSPPDMSIWTYYFYVVSWAVTFLPELGTLDLYLGLEVWLKPSHDVPAGFNLWIGPTVNINSQCPGPSQFPVARRLYGPVWLDTFLMGITNPILQTWEESNPHLTVRIWFSKMPV